MKGNTYFKATTNTNVSMERGYLKSTDSSKIFKFNDT